MSSEAGWRLIPFPSQFPNKGRFRTFTHSWNPMGYADTPQYTGQQAIRFPEDATPFECFIGGYLAAKAVLSAMYKHSDWPAPHTADDELLDLAEHVAEVAVRAYLGRVSSLPTPPAGVPASA